MSFWGNERSGYSQKSPKSILPQQDMNLATGCLCHKLKLSKGGAVLNIYFFVFFQLSFINSSSLYKVNYSFLLEGKQLSKGNTLKQYFEKNMRWWWFKLPIVSI
jgi:hypothetical protein